MSRLPRKPIPLGVKVDALLLHYLGVERSGVEWDHDPPLGLREFDPETGKYTPDEHDPRHITARLTQAHRDKTSGGKATVADGDVHKIHKARRLSKAEQEFKARLLKTEPCEPKRSKWPSRPFPKRAKK